jgi:hypothetical protein
MSQHLWKPVSWLAQEGIVDLGVTLASSADRPQMLTDVAMDWVRGDLRQSTSLSGIEMAFAAIFSTKTRKSDGCKSVYPPHIWLT